MKKILTSSVLMMLVFVINAQISLEHTYNFSASVVNFETLGYKYFLMDVPNSQCRIYNLDHSLFKTINCSVPSGCYLYDIKFLSENLFDSDSEIELLYTYNKYISGSDYYEYDSKIINENGTQILFIDGAIYNIINKSGDDKYKLFSYCYNFSSFPEVVWTNIYSLPGNPVVSAVTIEKNAKLSLKAFPNPAENTLKVEYYLPVNIETGVLHLFDNSGRPVNQFVVDHYSNHLDLDIAQMASGIYYYFLEFDGKKSPSQKLVVK